MDPHGVVKQQSEEAAREAAGMMMEVEEAPLQVVAASADAVMMEAEEAPQSSDDVVMEVAPLQALPPPPPLKYHGITRLTSGRFGAQIWTWPPKQRLLFLGSFPTDEAAAYAYDAAATQLRGKQANVNFAGNPVPPPHVQLALEAARRRAPGTARGRILGQRPQQPAEAAPMLAAPAPIPLALPAPDPAPLPLPEVTTMGIPQPDEVMEVTPLCIAPPLQAPYYSFDYLHSLSPCWFLQSTTPPPPFPFYRPNIVMPTYHVKPPPPMYYNLMPMVPGVVVAEQEALPPAENDICTDLTLGPPAENGICTQLTLGPPGGFGSEQQVAFLGDGIATTGTTNFTAGSGSNVDNFPDVPPPCAPPTAWLLAPEKFGKQ